MSALRGWTIQPWGVWELVRSGRAVTVDWRYAAGLHYGYDWLREQLAARAPGYVGHYPWWAFDARPDLRRRWRREPLGEPFALLELALPPGRAVALPAWAWDRIFYGEYVAADRRAGADWRRRLRAAFPGGSPWPLPGPWRSELHASWERVFDPAFGARGRRREARTVELVFEVLDRPVVVGATRFVGGDAGPGRARRTTNLWVEGLGGPSRLHRE